MSFTIPDAGRPNGVSVWTIGCSFADRAEPAGVSTLARVRGRVPAVGMRLRLPARGSRPEQVVRLAAVRSVVSHRMDVLARVEPVG